MRALFLILLLVACTPTISSAQWVVVTTVATPTYAPAASTDNAAVKATIQAREAQDAAATFEAIAARETAAASTATRAVVAVTEAAQASATSIAVAATATAERQNLHGTAVAMEIGATGTSVAQAGAATAQAITLNATATAQVQKAVIADMLRRDEEMRLANLRRQESARIQRQQVWDGLWPWLLTVLVATGLAGFLLAAWRRRPVHTVQTNDGTAVLVHDGHGGYHPLVEPRPAPALPAQTETRPEPEQLPAPRPPADWEWFTRWPDPLQVPIGVDAAEQPILIDRNREPHVLILGTTGSGKTLSGLVPFATAMLGAGLNVVLVNGRGADFSELESHPNVTAFPRVERALRPQLLARVLRVFVEELDRRDYVLARFGVRSWHQLPDYAQESGEVLLCIDEFLSLVLAQDNKRAEAEMWHNLIVLTSEGRKFGLYVALTATDPTERALGKRGMTLRDQMARIAFNMRNPAASRTILSCGHHDGFPHGSVGLPTGQFVANVMGQVRQGVAFYPSPAEIRHYCESRPIPPTPLPTRIAAELSPGQIVIETEESLQAAVDGRSLDGVIGRLDSLNDVARYLMDTDERPSGQTIRDRVKPALEWRISELGCEDSARLLSRAIVP